MKSILKILLISTIFLTACSNEVEETAAEQVFSVEIVKAVKEEVSIPILTSGKLSASQEANLSFKIPGVLKSLNVKEGENVAKGQILASLDLAEINANLIKSENGLNKAQRDFERIENLYNEKVATLEQLQNTKTALEVAQSDYNIAKFNRDYSVITSPDKGKILMLISEENEIVNAGYPVLIFGSTNNSWKMNVGLSDKDITKVKIGDQSKIKFDAFPNEEFSAKVISVGQGSDPRTGTYDVEIELEKTNFNLASGFIGKVEIFPSKKEELVLIPIESLVEANNKTAYVFIPIENERVTKKKISIKSIINDKVCVSNGLEGSENIISTGAEYLQQGVKIKIENKL